jgi:hypothetical protein
MNHTCFEIIPTTVQTAVLLLSYTHHSILSGSALVVNNRDYHELDCFLKSLQSTPLNNPDYNHHDGKNQQYMNEATHGTR